jgi:hypothetical protein
MNFVRTNKKVKIDQMLDSLVRINGKEITTYRRLLESDRFDDIVCDRIKKDYLLKYKGEKRWLEIPATLAKAFRKKLK